MNYEKLWKSLKQELETILKETERTPFFNDFLLTIETVKENMEKLEGREKE